MEQQLRKDPVTGIYSYVDVEEPKEVPVKEVPVKEVPVKEAPVKEVPVKEVPIKVTKPMKKK